MDWTTYFGDELVDIISDSELGELMVQAREACADVHVDLRRNVVVVANQ